MTTYQTLIDRLFHVNLYGGMKLGLETMLFMHEQLNYPTKEFKSIHVAGSNGKGSVATKIAKGLELSGLTVGLYTSPHISCFRERIKINDEMISEDDTAYLLSKIFEIKDLYNTPCTFFEITTLLAFAYFALKKVDVVVIEVGLGGRLDATNIVTPILSVITSISLDHTDILGNTVEEITREKAGIIKPDIPVVIGPHVSASLIKEIAEQNNSPVIEVVGNFQSFEEENNQIAKKALEYLQIPEPFILNGLQAKQPCRMETIHFHDKTIVLDVAHNPDGLTRLFSDLQEKYQTNNFRIIFGLSQNKDIDGCLEILQKSGASFHIVAAKNGRAAKVEDLKNRFLSSAQVFTHDSVDDAIHKALKFNDIIIICGTFFIMSDARRALKQNNPCDTIDMNERNLFKL